MRHTTKDAFPFSLVSPTPDGAAKGRTYGNLEERERLRTFGRSEMVGRMSKRAVSMLRSPCLLSGGESMGRTTGLTASGDCRRR